MTVAIRSGLFAYRPDSWSDAMAAQTFPLRYIEFDRLPDSAFVDITVIALLEDCAEITVLRRVERGLIIPPQKRGGHRRWNVGEYRNSRKPRS
jgi:hypothetical protein